MGERGSTRPADGIARHVPALAWLPGYQAWLLPRDLVARVEGGLWYANAEFVADRLADLAEGCDPPCRVVVLDLEETADLDITLLKRLRQFVDREHRAGRSLLLARVHGQAEDQLRAEGLLGSLDGVFPTVEAEVDQAVRITRPG